METKALRLRLEPKFWAKVNKHGPVVVESLGPCWAWTASTNGAGYGKISVGSNKSVLAHRLSKSLADGSDVRRPELCLHLCDNRLCVNPDHLYWGTHSDNNFDSIARSGRKTGFAPSDRCARGRAKTKQDNCKVCAYMRDVAKTWRRVLDSGREYTPSKKVQKRLSAMGVTLEYIEKELMRKDFA